MKKHFILAGLVMILGFVVFQMVRADEAGADEASGTDDQTQAQLFVAQVKPKAYVIHNGQQHEANPPEMLAEGDWIQTGDQQKAYLEFQNGGVVEVGPNSRVQVKKLEITPDDFKARFLLAVGKFKAKVTKLTTASSSFEVEAGGVVAGVRGTVFGVDYDQTNNQVSEATFEGSVVTQSSSGTQVADKGYSVVVDHTGAPSLSALTQGQIQSFEQFTDVAGLLEQEKQKLLDQMKQRLLQKIPKVVPGQDIIQNAIGQKLGF